MNKIDEIALRVADEVFTGNCEDNSEILAFTNALLTAPDLLAELSKDAEPVAEYVGASVIQVLADYIEPGTPLFTSPPNTADIEQRVAEACAKYCDNLKTYHVETGRPVLASVAEHAAHYLRGGKWREYL